MSTRTCMRFRFICTEDDSHTEKIYLWNDDKEGFQNQKCSSCGASMVYEEPINGDQTVFKGLKSRPVEEGKKRSLDHFKKEVYPTLPKSERRHFSKKHNMREF